MTWAPRVAGRVAGALVVLAALPGLAGCGPPSRPLTAIRARDGQPVVLLAGCADFKIDDVSIVPESGDSTAVDNGPYRALNRTGSVVPDSMIFFDQPPAGWSVSQGVLTELAPDKTYNLMAYARADQTVPITFTSADLNALGPDEVLIGKLPGGHRKVTESDFRRRAKDSC
jgi:hypothetical protein